MKFSIGFSDFWSDFNYSDNYFTHLLGDYITKVDNESPDVLFYSFAGNKHLTYRDSIKFFFTGENIRPDFTAADYCITFDHIHSERHFRWPLYNLYGLEIPKPDNSSRDRFCGIVVSNSSCMYRNVFFSELSKIKQVDSGGKFANNVGGPVQDKLEFLSHYKFTLCFENSSYPGYTTEKLLEAKKAGCVPIYWGNPEIEKEFNPESFINVHKYRTWENAFSEILLIDANDTLFEKMQTAPLLLDDTYTNEMVFKDWIVKRANLATDRAPVEVPIHKPVLDVSWILKLLRYSYFDVLTRKIGVKRFVRAAIHKT